MDRKDFILKIISLYPDTFREDRPEHVQAWVEMYEKAIPRYWDMDKLLYIFATNYKSTTVPPHPSFFYEYRNEVRPELKQKVVEPSIIQTPEEEEACRKKMKEINLMMQDLKCKMDISR